MQSRLRLFTGENRIGDDTPALVSVRLGEIVQPLADAINSNRTFVNDFADDEIQLSSDLYDVLKKFHRIQASA